MGREARAAARWGDRSGMVTALLEGDVLLVRGEIKATVARAAVRDVTIDGGELRFLADDVPVALTLGTTAARRWAADLAAGPPTLERKLGIDPGSRARVYGTVDDDALAAALARAASVVRAEETGESAATLVFVRASGGRELETALSAHLESGDATAPLWVVYRKGKDVPLNEAAVRAAGRARGLVDTKIAGISPALSALRFEPRAAGALPAGAAAPSVKRAEIPRRRR